MMKLSKKLDKNPLNRIQDEPITKEDEMHVRPAVGNTNVTRSLSDLHNFSLKLCL
jgi:hypothetical protein